MKKLFSNLCKNKRKNFPKMKSQMTMFLSIKELVRTFQPVNTVAKMVVRHERSREWEIDVQFMGNITSPKLIIRFHQDDGSNFTDRDRFNFIWRRSNKTRSQFCWKSPRRLQHFRAIQGHTGEICSHVRCWPRPQTSQWEGGCIPSRLTV